MFFVEAVKAGDGQKFGEWNSQQQVFMVALPSEEPFVVEEQEHYAGTEDQPQNKNCRDLLPKYHDVSVIIINDILHILAQNLTDVKVSNFGSDADARNITN